MVREKRLNRFVEMVNKGYLRGKSSKIGWATTNQRKVQLQCFYCTYIAGNLGAHIFFFLVVVIC